MSRMTGENRKHIRQIFEARTGVSLCASRPVRAQRALLLAAAVACCLAMAAFTLPLFSSLDGDELSLCADYAGNGIVYIRVENQSDKVLEFQKQTSLFRWVTGEEIPRLGGKVRFENTTFSPHSTGIMTVDLSAAYDMESLEKAAAGEEWFYLLLTNNNFLFGQDWMCSVNFGPVAQTQEEETVPSAAVAPEIGENIREELQFYFAESYNGELMAFNEANFLYQQKVKELLTRFPGKVVSSLSPAIMVGEASRFLDPEPVMGKPGEGVVFDDSIPREEQYLLTFAQWHYTDACGRMVATAEEKAWTQVAVLPQHPGETDGGATLPLIFLFVYDVQQALPENHVFVYGQIYSFEELADCLVLTDEHYAVYDFTSLIYTDLDAYLDHFLTTRSDIWCDDSIRQRVRNIYDFYQEKDNIREMYGYLQLPES